jgi:ribosome-associated protein
MPTLEFTLDGDYIEINLLLKLAGVCDSGGAGKTLVAGGQVTVDGQPEIRKTAKIRAGQTVSCGDVQIVVIADPVGGQDQRKR